MKHSIVIWGAGKIGRGFLAEAFYAGGYDVVLVDADQDAIDALNVQGRYTIIKAPADSEPELVSVAGFCALHTSETNEINAHIRNTPYVGIAVFPGVFDALADTLAAGIAQRVDRPDPLDVIVCANARGAADDLRSRVRQRLDDAGKNWLDQHAGFIETVILRIGVPTPDRFKEHGTLSITTNGYPTMPVDAAAFRGPFPDTPILVASNDIHAEEERKFFTYNMAHSVYAYAGRMRGHKTVLEAAADPVVAAEVAAALDEAGRALIREHGFGEEEMTIWNAQVIKNLGNPLLEDTLERLGKDPIRKLGRDDRLVGPARLCKRHGVLPWYLTRTIARAFFFDIAGDPATDRLQALLKEKGIASALREVGELDKDPEIVALTRAHFGRLMGDPAGEENYSRVAVLRNAYENGYRYEKTFHGCAQCALASLFDVDGVERMPIFEAASAFAGGVGLTGDGICGGYAGGVMWMGSYVGRRLDHFDGDKDRQYKSFEMTQRLRDRFLETYGSITCRHIHEAIFDRAYILRSKEVRKEFEAAGAHTDRCTSVVAMASLWSSEIMMDEGFIDPGKASSV